MMLRSMGRRFKRRIVEDVVISGIADKGKSVGRDAEGRVFFVDNAVPGDRVDVEVYKKRKGFFMGHAKAFKTLSADRTEPFCAHFEHCGGCKWQHLDYEAQTRHKQQTVADAIRRIAHLEPQSFRPILPAPETTFYRNKLEFTFSNTRWLTPEEIGTEVSNKVNVLGFHPPGSFDKVIDIQKCWLQMGPSNAFRNGIREIARAQELDFYDTRAHKGFLRQFMVRTTTLDQSMLMISFGEDDPDRRDRFLEAVQVRFPKLTTLQYCVNTKWNDTFHDLDILTYAGPGYVEEQLGAVRFRIGPKSFFQTNTRQARTLYDLALEFAGLSGKENVYDLYTGIGSIALYAAAQAKQVVGIEEVEEAIADAHRNADLNGVSNCRFYAGDVRNILTEDFAREHGKPDVLITDPPRAGMHADVVRMLLALEAPRLVYVSCNPATQARDLKLLSEKYELMIVQPVDMFPHTHHVESVARLDLKK